MSDQGRFPGVPDSQVKRADEWMRRVAITINNLRQGKMNVTGDITLTTSVATTTIALAPGKLGEDSIVLFEPTTSNAASELYGGTMFVSTKDVVNKKVHITHANNSNNDRIFRYAIIG